jgi:hypothetical protein
VRSQGFQLTHWVYWADILEALERATIHQCNLRPWLTSTLGRYSWSTWKGNNPPVQSQTLTYQYTVPVWWPELKNSPTVAHACRKRWLKWVPKLNPKVSSDPCRWGEWHRAKCVFNGASRIPGELSLGWVKAGVCPGRHKSLLLKIFLRATDVRPQLT